MSRLLVVDDDSDIALALRLLFVNAEGVPINEYLPEDHEGRAASGVVEDPTPGKGRAVARVLEKQAQEGGTS